MSSPVPTSSVPTSAGPTSAGPARRGAVRPRRLSRSGDPSEREADRAADVVARGGSVSGWSFSAVPLSAAGTVNRQVAPPDASRYGPTQPEAAKPPDALAGPADKEEDKKYSEGASAAADRAVNSPEGQQLLDAITNSQGVRQFAKAALTPGGIVGLVGGGAAVIGTLGIGGADMPTLPKVPLDFLIPGLKAKLVWKGRVDKPDEVGIEISLGAPTAKPGAPAPAPPEPDPGPMGMGPTPEDPKGAATKSMDKSIEDARARAAAGIRRDGLAMCAKDAFGRGQVVTVVLWPSRRILPARPSIPTLTPAPPIQTWGYTPPVQREATAGADPGVLDTGATDIDGALAGGGRALDHPTRAVMESRFGVDFSSVRIHDDARAAETARSIDAVAFTAGEDVVFDSGRYSPASSEGRHLLAHELAHVVQQSRAADGIQRLQRRGVGEWLGIFFGTEEGNWTDAELLAYLKGVTDVDAIEGSFDSDNKARAIVAKWKGLDPAFALTTDQRVVLIKEMIDGPTLIEDETAIVDLLVGSKPDEGVEILGEAGVPLSDIESDVDDEKQRKRLDRWLESSFDGGRKAVLAGRIETISPTKRSTFEEMAEGGVSRRDAADKIQLPPELTDALAEAWSKSFPGGKSKEQGGLLVRKDDGSLEWIKATRSTSGSTTLPFDDVPDDATPIVGAHTHPYDKSEGGHTGVTFSGGDLANLVTQSLPLKVVHAGDRYFAIAKTSEFEALVDAADDSDELGEKMREQFKKARNAASGSFSEQVLTAAKAICRRYKLALYEGGLDGSLTKIELGPVSGP